MNPETSNAIIGQWGAFGAIFLLTVTGMGYWIVRLQRSLDTAQDKRVTDAQGVADRVLSLAERHSESDLASASSIQTQATAVTNLVTEVRDLRGESQRAPTAVREATMTKDERRASVEKKLEERRARPPSEPPKTDFDEEEVTDVLDIALCKLEKAAADGAKARQDALAHVEKLSKP